DVIYTLSDTMVRRHPHVFGTAEAETAEDVMKNWQEIKAAEKGNNEETSLLSSINKSMPASMQAYEIQKAAAKVGFDWDKAEEAWEKVKEEITEFEAEMKQGEQLKLEDEWGDIIFALSNVARFYHIHPEEALMKTNRKFKNRFAFVEEKVKESGIPFL